MTSMESVQHVETEGNARRRQSEGRTVCSKLFKRALDLRWKQLAAEVAALEEDPDHDVATAKALHKQVNYLKIKTTGEGPLYFGLRHAAVQDHMQKLLEEAKGGEGAQEEEEEEEEPTTES